MKPKKMWLMFLALVFLLGVTFLFCIAIGSVFIPMKEVLNVLFGAMIKTPANHVAPETPAILLQVRLPRILTVALVGASLSLCGVAMQGLLKNPLADGSTLGICSGASLGAVLAILLNIGSLTGMSILFSFASLILILSFSHILDHSLSTNTIILVGVIFSMFASSATSLLVTFMGDKAKNIMFWSMGSFSHSSFKNAGMVAISLIFCGGILLLLSRELNAFSLGESNAHNLGVPVRTVKLVIMIAVSISIGICVSVSGTIGFVGLIIPHMIRFITGPNHRYLLPASLFGGAIFLLLADLVSRVIFSPVELPIGVVTSFIGSITFIYIFYHFKRKH